MRSDGRSSRDPDRGGSFRTPVLSWAACAAGLALTAYLISIESVLSATLFGSFTLTLIAGRLFNRQLSAPARARRLIGSITTFSLDEQGLSAVRPYS